MNDDLLFQYISTFFQNSTWVKKNKTNENATQGIFNSSASNDL